MLKTDLLELRKRYKKENCTLSYIGCYILSSEEDTPREYIRQKFLLLDDKEQYKYLDFAMKALATGKESMTEDTLVDEDNKKLLIGILTNKMESKDLMELLLAQIKKNYTYSGNYAVILFTDDYDVPVKTNDKQRLDESEEVYSYMLCCICPIKPSDAGLGYYSEKHAIHCIDIVQALQRPNACFIYPSFHDRSADRDNVFCNSKDKQGQELLVNMFGCKPMEASKTEIKSIPKKNSTSEPPAPAQDPVISENHLIIADDQPDLEEIYEPDELIDTKDMSQTKSSFEDLDADTETNAAVTMPETSSDSKNHDDAEIIPIGNVQIEVKNINGKECFVIPAGSVTLADLVNLINSRMK